MTEIRTSVKESKNYVEITKCRTDWYYYPKLYEKENGSGINTTTIKTDGIGISDNGYESLTKDTYSSANESGLRVTRTFYGKTANSDNFGEAASVLAIGFNYWIASRCVDFSGDNIAFFCLRQAQENDYISESMMYSSSNGTNVVDSAYLRPVATIPSSVKIIICSGENSDTNMYEIR